MTEATADDVARLLSNVWTFYRSSCFLEYVANTFRKTMTEWADFQCIYIGLAHSGNVVDGVVIGSVKWWVVDDAGFRRCGTPKLPMYPSDPENLHNGFYRIPTMRFYIEGDRIAVGESFGPMLLSRKVGRIQQVDGNLIITHVETKLTSGDL
jgi:hypothetical protein